jgi:cytochrome c556
MTLRRKALIGAAAGGLAALVATLAVGQDQKRLESAIEARQGAMHIHAWEAGPLFAMAKGDAAYDGEAAAERASALKALLNYDETRLFPEGSSNAEMPDKTRALPAIWEKPDEFHQHFEDLRSAVDTLASEAGKGQEAFVAAMGPVGKACGDCHEDFRQKQD